MEEELEFIFYVSLINLDLFAFRTKKNFFD